VAHIQTAYVKSRPLTHVIHTVGRLAYDEGTLRTIAAWVPGRLERLYADYTGVVVTKNDHLALVYSPDLYSGQVELLVAKKARQNGSSNSRSRLTLLDSDLYENSRQRLIELGMTEEQIDQVEKDGKANSRMHLCAPISGTVIEKLATEGEYVKEGQPIYKLADLSTVWLMLELFPEDAASIRYGQKVEAEVQSLPGRIFSGRVAFMNPHVDEETRTVGVRVVIANPNGVLRIGDFANASISAPVGSAHVAGAGSPPEIYDPELADKWISPRHPHIVASGPGKCPVCAVDLVPAADFGFASVPQISDEVLTVPRNAVLMAGKHSVVYVETEPGRFEIRTVVLGPGIDDEIVVLQGVTVDEHVAISGNFLIDSQMQLAGNPSLIDPTRALPLSNDVVSPESIAALEKLSAGDRKLAEEQRICPVKGFALGSMGVPPKVEVNEKIVFLCCEGCRDGLLADPEKYFAILEEAKKNPNTFNAPAEMELPPIGEMTFAAPDIPQMVPPLDVPHMVDVPLPSGIGVDNEAATIAQSLSRLSEGDLQLARKQTICPVAQLKLGTMGPPIKVNVEGRSVFICCEGCRAKLLNEPSKYLARLPKESAQ
jgi:membrane fusion protein, copper/silver efflux system